LSPQIDSGKVRFNIGMIRKEIVVKKSSEALVAFRNDQFHAFPDLHRTPLSEGLTERNVPHKRSCSTRNFPERIAEFRLLTTPFATVGATIGIPSDRDCVCGGKSLAP
jgi:hypothetical protein